MNMYFYASERRGLKQGRNFFFLSKHERHAAIRELIAQRPISRQDELRRKLIRRGFDVTQATLSRDIHELQIYKGPNGYELPSGNGRHDETEVLPDVEEMLRSFGLKVKQAQNQLVLFTAAGSAQPVALAIDHEDWPEVVGTLAGDDTILIICPDQRKAGILAQRLDEIIG